MLPSIRQLPAVAVPPLLQSFDVAPQYHLLRKAELRLEGPDVFDLG